MNLHLFKCKFVGYKSYNYLFLEIDVPLFFYNKLTNFLRPFKMNFNFIEISMLNLNNVKQC